MEPVNSYSSAIVTTHTPLSHNNKNVLQKHLLEKCGPAFKEATLKTAESGGVLSKIYSYFPSSQSSGRLAGYAVAQTHGAEISNGLICRVADFIFPKQPQDTQKGYGQAIFGAFFNVAKPTLEETTKMMVTPKILPYVTMACQGIGGLLLPSAVSLTMLLINRVLSDPNSKFTPDKLPPLNELVRIQDGRYVDANGNKLSEQDLQDIRVAVNRYDLVCKLIGADQEDIESIFLDYLKVDSTHADEPLNLKFADGTTVTPKQYEKIILAFQRLKSQNVTGESMWKAIKLLADHLPVPVPPKVEKLEDDWFMIEDKKDEI